MGKSIGERLKSLFQKGKKNEDFYDDLTDILL